MDLRVRKKRLDSLDALVQEHFADDSSDDEEFDDKHPHRAIHARDHPHTSSSSSVLAAPHANDHSAQTDVNNKDPKKTTTSERDSDLYIDDHKIIALINSGSGARKGWILTQELTKLNAVVFNLKDVCVNDAIRERLASSIEQYDGKCIVLICGGDGSQAWAASLVDRSLNEYHAKHNVCVRFPAMCVFPMGTGNDLSRSLGWGTMEPNHKNLVQYIADIHFCANITKRWSDLDRWRVTYTLPHLQDNNNNDNCKDVPPTRPTQYEIEPPQQWYLQQTPSTPTYQHLATYEPPLPSTFLCYLSVGYDALVAYKFEQERKLHPERFNNQLKNQVMYVKHGFTEFFKPSEPITDDVDIWIDDECQQLPSQCRSLKLININSAMNGCFFWGNGKSREFEYQQRSPPRLDDSHIEVMATRGVHDMLQHRVNLTHAQRISQTKEVVIRFNRIPSQGIALQIDGEAWIIRHCMTLRVQLHDKLPVVIGYNAPRGVQSWLQASLDDQTIVKAKEAFRERLKQKYIDTESSPELAVPPYSDEDKDMKESGAQSLLGNLFKSSSTSSIAMQHKQSQQLPPPQQQEMEMEMQVFHDSSHVPRSPSPEDKHVADLPFFDVPNAPNVNANANVNMNGTVTTPTFMDKLGDLLKGKSSSSRKLNSEQKNCIEDAPPMNKEEDEDEDDNVEETMPDEVDMNEYLRNNPTLQNDKHTIFKSPVFSPSSEHKDAVFLDRFTWWKVTRAKNFNKSIDAETAHDAISPQHHTNSLRKTQSFVVLPKKGRSASLF